MPNLFNIARAKEKKEPIPKRSNHNREFNFDYEEAIILGEENHSVEEYIIFYSKKKSKKD